MKQSPLLLLSTLFHLLSFISAFQSLSLKRMAFSSTDSIASSPPSAPTGKNMLHQRRKKRVLLLPENNMLYCSMVVNPDDENISTPSLDDVSDSETSESSSSAQPQDTMGREVATSTASTWKEQLLRCSNVASLLCILDCTILPFLTLVLPMLSFSATWLHEMGHAVALRFVLPVGFLATTSNYAFSHQKWWITAIGWVGLMLIGVANYGTVGCGHGHGHEHTHSHRGTLQFLLLQQVLQFFHHGIQHRLANLTGCFLLMFSNWLSQRHQQKLRKANNSEDGCGPECNHSLFFRRMRSS